MEYLHNETDEQKLTLHDCRADRMELREGVLSFFFPGGIRLVPAHPDNPTDVAVRTGPARVDFPLLTGEADDISVCVFRRLCWFLTVSQEWPVEKLADVIGEGKCELEFITRFDSYVERLYECCLWQERKPYHRDCQNKITTKLPVYRWNEIRMDREA